MESATPIEKFDPTVFWQRLDSLRAELSVLKDKVHQQDIDEVVRESALRSLISDAVRTGATQNTEVLNELKDRITEVVVQNNQQLKGIEKRVQDLEDYETKKLAQRQLDAQQERKNARRHLRNTVVAAVISFFAALILNNMISVIADALKGGV